MADAIKKLTLEELETYSNECVDFLSCLTNAYGNITKIQIGTLQMQTGTSQMQMGLNKCRRVHHKYKWDLTNADGDITNTNGI